MFDSAVYLLLVKRNICHFSFHVLEPIENTVPYPSPSQNLVQSTVPSLKLFCFQIPLLFPSVVAAMGFLVFSEICILLSAFQRWISVVLSIGDICWAQTEKGKPTCSTFLVLESNFSSWAIVSGMSTGKRKDSSGLVPTARDALAHKYRWRFMIR